ncbi:MAG: PSD1 domain-containing protein [Planctomycetes bacterium]|nr:PSD1 domain-containing protein [Planctomycetota bacterium]
MSERCYQCHGSQKQKGQLRLDVKTQTARGGDSQAVIVPGHPEMSELYRRITLGPEDEDRMPGKGEPLSNRQIERIGLWIKQGASWPVEGEQASVYQRAPLALRKVLLPPASDNLKNPVDRIVNNYFESQGVSWGKPVADRRYARRVWLDVVGLLPEPNELEVFVTDRRADKRERLVDNLLSDRQGYALHWMSFWNDALRNDYAGTGYIDGGRKQITAWLYDALRKNMPYDQFVRELIDPAAESAGFVRGIKWRGTVNASQKPALQAAQNISLVFLGLNLKCASCHDSFINDWTLAEAYKFANIYSDEPLEIFRCDKPTGIMAERDFLFPALGKIDASAAKAERLKQLGSMMTSKKNGRLARTIVNRLWAKCMGAGLIEPVDEMDNQPWSPDLLDFLAVDLVEHDYDLQHLIKGIVTSRVYQLTAVGLDEQSVRDREFVFRGPFVRRMSAEQFVDTVSRIVGPVYQKKQNRIKAIEFEGPIRAVAVTNDPLLSALGRPNRDQVNTSRRPAATLLQALELTSGSMLQEVIQKGAQEKLKTYGARSDQWVTEVFRMALGREPLDDERRTAMKTIGKPMKRKGVEDFLWAILMLPEFQLIY